MDREKNIIALGDGFQRYSLSSSIFVTEVILTWSVISGYWSSNSGCITGVVGYIGRGNTGYIGSSNAWVVGYIGGSDAGVTRYIRGSDTWVIGYIWGAGNWVIVTHSVPRSIGSGHSANHWVGGYDRLLNRVRGDDGVAGRRIVGLAGAIVVLWLLVEYSILHGTSVLNNDIW